MGHGHSNFDLASEARHSLDRFDDCEIHVIRETFKDLCHLSGESTRIDKEMFLQYFPLPGLLGERLFAVFDKKGIGEIDYEEFVRGLSITCRGTWEERVQFVFNIYDVHGTGAVSKEELTALLNQVPRSVMSLGNEQRNGKHTHTHDPHGGGTGSAYREKRAATAPAAAVVAREREPADSDGSDDTDSGANELVSRGSEPLPLKNGHSSGHHYHHHFDEFTNNDMIEQAFTECDLNHDGKLSFSEFRLWVERNPMVTRFLQSVFPYDEYRQWGNDFKHLPFIHNKSITEMMNSSDESANSSVGDERDEEDETRKLLVRAQALTQNSDVKEGITHLLEMLQTDTDNGNEANYSLANPIAYAPHAPMEPMSPRLQRMFHHQTITKCGILSKRGHRFHGWKDRWYVVVGNSIYYYNGKNDRFSRGVIFLTGSFVEPLREEENERRGYWGFEITRANEQHTHRRRLYAQHRAERDRWVHELRRASEVVPIEDEYEIGDELGKGRFSRVCLCVNKKTLERKAVKIIEKESMDAEEKELLRCEIAIMKLVNHPNIIRMETVYESRQHMFIVMELHSGGELFDRIVGRPRCSEDETFCVIYPLVESVAYLHEMGIVHRDLKPENILCGERIGDIKIADFGLSKLVLPDEIMKMPCGTLSYVAPEVLTLNGYGREADIWSVGTIMFLLMRGRLPFDGETREEIIENTINGVIDTVDVIWQGYSAEAKDLLLGLLNKDIKRRMTAKDVLRHPWITSRVDRMEKEPEAFNF